MTKPLADRTDHGDESSMLFVRTMRKIEPHDIGTGGDQLLDIGFPATGWADGHDDLGAR
jgi:hypothetical protein